MKHLYLSNQLYLQYKWVVVKFSHWKSGEKGIEDNRKLDVIK